MVKLAGRNDMACRDKPNKVRPAFEWCVQPPGIPIFLKVQQFFFSLVVWLIFLLEIKTNALAV